MLTRRWTSVLTALAILVGLATPASAADPADCRYTAAGQVCEVHAVDPGHNGATAPAGTSSPAKVTCADIDGKPIDCTSEWGTWSNDRRCWVELMSPQPPPSDPIWEDRTDGAIYWCQPPSLAGAIGGGHMLWAPAPPPQVNPSRLARQALDSMDLNAPAVGATPLPSADAVSVIGLPTWLWIDDADSHSWGPITRTASAGGVTVTATARVAKVVWDMGDGQTVTCTSQGTVWTAEKGTGDSPTCGYRYTRPGQRTITATTFWEVDWSGAGQTGTITFDMSGTRTVNVVELRAVITG
ncbi:MAG: hypothetical protein WCF04_05215 [Candidatus Nanopelagicales bacterium]